MATTQPPSTTSKDPISRHDLVRVQVVESVDQLNARGPISAETFATVVADSHRCELIEGKVRLMSPAGSEHGYIAAEIAFLLQSHVRLQRLGRVYAAETGFLLQRSPDTVRAPDVAFISAKRLSEHGETRGFGQIIPDLVIEVQSPSDQLSEVEEKTEAWLTAGVRCVLNVQPRDRTASAHRSGDVTMGRADEVIDLFDVVDQWTPKVADFFGSDA